MALKTGVIYCLANSADKQVVKVGKTNDPQRRLKEHNNASNVVGKWRYVWKIEVPLSKLDAAEKDALTALRQWKVKGRLEQFEIDPAKARKVVALVLHPYDEWGRQERTRLDRAHELQVSSARKVLAQQVAYSDEWQRRWKQAEKDDWLDRVISIGSLPAAVLLAFTSFKVAAAVSHIGWGIAAGFVTFYAILHWSSDIWNMKRFDTRRAHVERDMQLPRVENSQLQNARKILGLREDRDEIWDGKTNIPRHKPSRDRTEFEKPGLWDAASAHATRNSSSVPRDQWAWNGWKTTALALVVIAGVLVFIASSDPIFTEDTPPEVIRALRGIF